MGWVIGGIGSIYLLRDAALRLPALLSTLLPARMLNPTGSQRETVQMPVGGQAVVSS
jgi:hypothetical protein